MRASERVRRALREGFTEVLADQFSKAFARELEVRYDIIAGVLVTVPADGGPFPLEQVRWIAGFEAAWHAAANMAEAAARR